MNKTGMEAPLDPSLAPSKREVLEALTRELYARGRISVAFLVGVLLILRTFIESAWTQSRAVRIAFAATLILAVARGLICWVVQRGDVRIRWHLFGVSTMLLGASLGGFVLAVYPRLDPLHIALLAVCAAGFNSVATVSMALGLFAYFSYVLMSLGSLGVAALVWPNGQLGPGFAALIFIYIAALAATALHVRATRIRLVELQHRFRELARRDSLTKLHNRRFVMEYMDRRSGAFRSERRAGAARRVLGAMVVDVDHFKRVNDRFGHDAGDAVLRQLGGILQGSVRASDILVRWGGEEFVILSADADRESLLGIAERIRHRCEERVFALPTQQTVRVTCSIGYTASEISLDGVGILRWQEVVGLADHALAHAKATGRNRSVGVSLSEQAQAPTASILRVLSDSGVEEAVRSGLIEVTLTAGNPVSQGSGLRRSSTALRVIRGT